MSLWGIIGHTGSGKSTLIQHLNGLLKPSVGQVLFEGTDIWADKQFTRQVRFQVGLVFQYPEYQLFEETVYKDIAFGPKNMKLSEDEVHRRVMEAASFVELTEDLLGLSPFELSGGQKRRVAIAGVIAMEPKVLILDEPTAGLDPKGRAQILGNIRTYQAAKDATVIMVSHSMEEIADSVERLVVVNDAHIAMDGMPREVFSQASELERMGLAVPQVTKVFLRLKELGLAVDSSVYTTVQAKEQLMMLKARREVRWMLKDITIGQYFPGSTAVHRMDPRTKILDVLLYIIALFTCQGIIGYLLVLTFLASAVWISKIRLKTILKGVKPLIFIIVFTAILNMFYTPGNELFHIWKLRVTDAGVKNAVLIVARIIMLITGTFLLTYTTSPMTLTDGLERLLGPLKRVHLPVHELTMIMSIARVLSQHSLRRRIRSCLRRKHGALILKRVIFFRRLKR